MTTQLKHIAKHHSNDNQSCQKTEIWDGECPHKIAIVKLTGEIGEQMYQYAFFLWLQKNLSGIAKCYLICSKAENILESTFPTTIKYFISNELRNKIDRVNPVQTDSIRETEPLLFHQPFIPNKSITFFEGQWTYAGYEESVRDILEQDFGHSMSDMEQTAKHFLFFGSYLRDIGLFEGKMGLIIFLFHYSRHSGKTLYEDFAIELFEDICRDISPDTPIGLGYGLSGIGWGIIYLIQNRFIEDNANEILEDIDKKIIEFDLTRIEDTSLKTGFQGIAIYLYERLKDRSCPYDARFRMNFDLKCKKLKWIRPKSSIETICQEMIKYAAPYPAKSTCCWQRELLKLCKV